MREEWGWTLDSPPSLNARSMDMIVSKNSLMIHFQRRPITDFYRNNIVSLNIKKICIYIKYFYQKSVQLNMYMLDNTISHNKCIAK